MTAPWWAAVDMGASSVRVLAGSWSGDRIAVSEVGRFANRPVALPDGLHWDITGLWNGVLGLLEGEVARRGAPLSIGVDGWAVDYALLDGDGCLLGLPYHYRDLRTRGRVAELDGIVGLDNAFSRTGVRALELNTLCQLLAERDRAAYNAASCLLLLPDLICFFLTGARIAERTNATTTGYFSRDGRWDDELLDLCGLRHDWFPEVVEPGFSLGALRPALGRELGFDEPVQVVAVASHDTASAVAAVPAVSITPAYAVAGTWSLVGVELTRPVLSEEARLAGFTNEGGVDGTVRFLQNVMGFWLSQECERWWGHRCPQPDLSTAKDCWSAVFNPDTPGLGDRADDMPGRIRNAIAEAGGIAPSDEAGLTLSVLASLAATYAVVLRQAEELSGVTSETFHLVGGGSASAVLAQLTADAVGREVVAGPVEASGVGNLLMQRHSTGELAERGGLRAVVARSQHLRRYEPRSDGRKRAMAAVEIIGRLRGVTSGGATARSPRQSPIHPKPA